MLRAIRACRVELISTPVQCTNTLSRAWRNVSTEKTLRPQEWGRGTQECVRHVLGSGREYRREFAVYFGTQPASHAQSCGVYVVVVIAHAEMALVDFIDFRFNFNFEFHELTIDRAEDGRNGPSRASRTGTF